MTTSKQHILTDAETLEMLKAFYEEALSFLNVPKEQWADLNVGVAFDNSDGRAYPINIVYSKCKILVCLPLLQLIIRTNPFAVGDAPSVYRSYGYKLARLWQQYLKTGECRIFERDKDSCDFALALFIIKGLPQIDKPVTEEMTKAIGFNPYDREAAIKMLREEFGIDCELRYGYDIINKTKRPLVALTRNDALKRANLLKSLYEKSISQSLPKIEEGQLGSQSNPFQNVDEVAAYILDVEKERLANDPYRQALRDEQYYFDLERGYFRISWASPHVSFYPVEGANSTSFVVNQLTQLPGRHDEMPRFSIKPSLVKNKFLFRGQSKFYPKCVPSMFRDEDNLLRHQYVEDVIQINELEVLLRQHPLVKLFEQGFCLLNEFFRFRVDYIGLSQHYYNRTPMLDLTSDMEVAKFFAVTTFNMKDD